MPFDIVRDDITNIKADAIVNTANPKAEIGHGLDFAIHKKAGDKLLKARKRIGNIDVGTVAITPGYNLKAKYIIHTVGPIWKGGNYNEENLLSMCYRNALDLAYKKGCKSIAFPLISTGNYGFPKDKALQIAIREISNFLMNSDMLIYIVVFDKNSFALSEQLFKSVSSYIDDRYAVDKIIDEYGLSIENSSDDCELNLTIDSEFNERRLRDEKSVYDDEFLVGAAIPDISQSYILNKLDMGFSETLLTLIDNTGKKDSEIYKKANIDRRLFSKIRGNKNYKPSKITAIAFAIALELNIEETRDFIGRAGYALTHSSKFDIIVEYFIINKNYDIFQLNEVLFAFDQPIIGG